MRFDLEDVCLGRQREGKRAGWRREAPSCPPPFSERLVLEDGETLRLSKVSRGRGAVRGETAQGCVRSQKVEECLQISQAAPGPLCRGGSG